MIAAGVLMVSKAFIRPFLTFNGTAGPGPPPIPCTAGGGPDTPPVTTSCLASPWFFDGKERCRMIEQRNVTPPCVN